MIENIKLNILDIIHDDVSVNIEEDVENIFIITLYTKDIEGNNYIINIKDYKPYFYIKVPNDWSKKYCEEVFMKNIKNYYDHSINLYKISNLYKFKLVDLSDSYDFYGFNYDFDYNIEKKFRFMKLEFNNYRSFMKYKKSIKMYFQALKENKINCDKKIKSWINICIEECDSNLYEANINPIIKFIHKLNIEPSGWITLKNNSNLKLIEDKIFNCHEQIECCCDNIIPVKDYSEISNLIIASFDIECDSLNGDFPMAIKDFKQLSVDIFDTYVLQYNNYFKEYNVNYNHKLKYIKDIILTAYTKTNYIGDFYSNINYIKSDNNLIPTAEDINTKLISLNEDLVREIDNSIIEGCKKSRNKIINDIYKILNKEFIKYKLAGDPIIQIGTVFYSTKYNKYERYIQVIKPDNCIEEICDDIDNIVVERCKDEKDLLLSWKNMINKINPDIITGYNIFGFDFNYIHQRVAKYKMETMFYNLGKINSESMEYDMHYNKRCKLNKIIGSGMKLNNDEIENDEDEYKFINEQKYINMDGRIIFDVQEVIKKNHNLESYKLDNVSSHFMRGDILISDKVNPLKKLINIWNFENEKYWLFKTNNIGNLKKGDYITINIHSNIGEVLLYNKQKFMIKNIYDKHIKLLIPNKFNIIKEIKKYKYSKIEWCLNKDDITPKELFDLHKNGGPQGRSKIAKYCIQDCELCINLINLLDIIPNNIGMSNVCLVPFSYIFLRGQGIKVTSIISKECSINNYRMPTLIDYSNDNSGFEGAIVLEPITGIYHEEPIVVLDYASLYPSSIIENNLSHDKYVTDEKYLTYLKSIPANNPTKDIKTRFDEIIEVIEYDDYIMEKKGANIKKIKTGNKVVCHYIKNMKDESGNIIIESQGIVCRVLQNVLNARKSTRLKMKEPGLDGMKLKVLDGLQLAYKVTANSVYGQLGAKTSSIYKKVIAACTTCIGRKRIEDAENGVKKWAIESGYDYPEIVYGDTDSVFVKFSNKDLNGNILKGSELLKHCIECGINAGEYVDNTLRKPQNLEYEKTFFPFILISKKRYIGDKYESIKDVDNNKFKRTSMGIVMKRRDNAPIVKYVYGNIIEKIMVDKNFELALEWLEMTLNDIINGKFHEDYFIISKTLNSYYKCPKSIAHKVLSDRIGERDPGNRPKSNDRIPYMYIEIEEYIPCGYEIIYNKVQNGYYKNGKPKYSKIKMQGKQKFKKKLIKPGDRIETPEYIKEHNLKIDYKYYISNQIMNPVKQVLDLNTKYLDITNKIFTNILNK